ncbi:MAG: flagellar basal body P-ring formation chaperone FlgA [Myxococcota bacterium]
MSPLRLPLLLLVLPLLWGPTDARAAGIVRIPADVAVEGRSIVLGEIAILDGLNPDQESRVRELTLGPAAPPASHREFSGQALRERLAAINPPLVLDIAERVRVHTAYRDVQPDYLQARFKDAIIRSMPWPSSAVRFSAWRIPERFAVPAHSRRLLVHFRPDEDFLGRVTARLEILDASDPETPHVERAASVRLEVSRPVVVTTRRLRRGEILEPGAIRIEKRNLSSLPRGVLDDSDELLGQRLRRSLAEGSAVRATDLVVEPLLKRGDPVSVQAGRGALELRIEARALEAGGIGDVIRVENPVTRRRFTAKITGRGTARLAPHSVGAGP